MINQRMFDVCRVTRGGVTWTAINVSREEALLNMAVVLAAYDSNWQLQPENPTGCVRVCNRHSEEYHMILVIETEISIRCHDAERIIERQHMNWLARSVELNGSEATSDYTVDPNQTPTDNLFALLEDGTSAVESEVAYA